jgi:hypothetical protein
MTGPATLQWDANLYATPAAFVPALGAPVLDLLAPKPGEHSLDLGCGDGVLTQKLVDAEGDWIADYVRIRFSARLPAARDRERASPKE